MNSANKPALEIKLKRYARYLQISIPYDKDEGYVNISFDDGVTTELQCEEDFVPPMFNSENRTLEVTVDLNELKAVDWDEGKNYIHVWAKLCVCGTYTLLNADKKPLWQIEGYVPNALIPPYERGFGDYMELTINPDGSLPQWREELDFSDFVEKGREPQPVKNYKWKKHIDAMSANFKKKALKEYIIYTTEGYTIAPNENYEVENCQVLGFIHAYTEEEAKENLVKKNPWISEAGFNKFEFIARQIVTN